MDDGDWASPVALARNQPISQLVLDLALADAVGFQPLAQMTRGLFEGEPRVFPGIDEGRFLGHEGLEVLRVFEVALQSVLVVHVDAKKLRRWVLDRNHWDSELARELEVALISGRHRHDRACAVSREDVVGDPNGNRFSRYRIDCVRAGEDTRLFAI